MKKIILTTLALAVLTVPLLTIGQTMVVPPEEPEEIEKTIGSVVTVVFWIFTVIAVIMMIIAAYYFLTAAGDPEKVNTARNYIIWTVVALVVAFLSRAIVTLIKRYIFGI